MLTTQAAFPLLMLGLRVPVPRRKLATFPQGAGSPDRSSEAVSTRSAVTVGAGDSLGSPSGSVTTTVIFRCHDGRRSVHCGARRVPITIRAPCKGPSPSAAPSGLFQLLPDCFLSGFFSMGGCGGEGRLGRKRA